MTTTSISLLQRLRRKDESEAWERFVKLYTPLIFRWARNNGLTATEAEDLVQDVLSVVVVKIAEFQVDPEKSFRGWLRTVTVNRCRDLLRRRGRTPQVTRDGDLNPDARGGNDSFAELEYRQYVVNRALELMRTEFEESTWKACWECVVNDRRGDEVAQELGLTINAVYVAKSRVLRRLRHELEGLFE